MGALTHSAPALDLSLILELRAHERAADGRPGASSRAPEEIAELQAEVRALAAERDAVILAHNYQLPEVQDVADYVGDSLGLSRRPPPPTPATIVFCGVHFMAETASILSPEKTVLIPDLDAGCSLAGLDRRRAARRLEGRAPRAASSSCTSTPPPRSRR